MHLLIYSSTVKASAAATRKCLNSKQCLCPGSAPWSQWSRRTEYTRSSQSQCWYCFLEHCIILGYTIRSNMVWSLFRGGNWIWEMLRGFSASITGKAGSQPSLSWSFHCVLSQSFQSKLATEVSSSLDRALDPVEREPCHITTKNKDVLFSSMEVCPKSGLTWRILVFGFLRPGCNWMYTYEDSTKPIQSSATGLYKSPANRI